MVCILIWVAAVALSFRIGVEAQILPNAPILPPTISVACKPNDFLVAVSKNECGPLYSRPRTACNTLIRRCKCQHNIELKWTGRGCPGTANRKRRGDGGCQCANYCGWSCRNKCVNDPLKRCTWVNNKCINKYTLQSGPLSTCFPSTAVPTLSPTPPTQKPSRAPTREPTLLPTFLTKSPIASPTRSPSKMPTQMPSIIPSRSPSRTPSTEPSVSPSATPTSSPTMCDASQPPNATAVHQCDIQPRCASIGCGCGPGGMCMEQNFVQCNVNAVNRTFCCAPGDLNCQELLTEAGLPFAAVCPPATLCMEDCCSEVGALSCVPICYN